MIGGRRLDPRHSRRRSCISLVFMELVSAALPRLTRRPCFGEDLAAARPLADLPFERRSPAPFKRSRKVHQFPQPKSAPLDGVLGVGLSAGRAPEAFLWPRIFEVAGAERRFRARAGSRVLSAVQAESRSDGA